MLNYDLLQYDITEHLNSSEILDILKRTNEYDFFKYFENSLIKKIDINYDEMHNQLKELNSKIKRYYKLNKNRKGGGFIFSFSNSDTLIINTII